MLKDVLTVNEEIRRHFPELPLILFGHSMGSLAVRAFAAKHDDCMNMLIVCGSPSENKARPLGKAIAKVQENYWAHIIRVKFWKPCLLELMH